MFNAHDSLTLHIRAKNQLGEKKKEKERKLEMIIINFDLVNETQENACTRKKRFEWMNFLSNNNRHVYRFAKHIHTRHTLSVVFLLFRIAQSECSLFVCCNKVI